MRSRVHTLLMVLLAAYLPPSLGCIGKPAGFHEVPKEAYFDELITLEFKHIIRGSPGSGAPARYSKEQVFYRVGGDSDYKPAKVTRISASRDEVVYVATIPPIATGQGDVLEYYDTHLFDGGRTVSFKLNAHNTYEEVNASNPYRVELKVRALTE